MATEVGALQSVQEKVKERIQATFMDLLPAELFEGMVQTHLNSFLNADLPNLVKEEATKRLRAQIQAEFGKPEWVGTFGYDGAIGDQASLMVARIVQEAAPQLVAALFGGMVQNAVQHIRNSRGY